jgi:hypothetical protein
MSRAPGPLPLLALQQQFRYIPETGIIIRKSTNKPTGWQHPSGYCYLSFREGRAGVKQRNLLFHRVAFALYHGVDPHPLEIDHINRVRNDNTIINLRVVTSKEQNNNRVSCDREKIGKGMYQLKLFTNPTNILEQDYMGGNAFQTRLL